MFFLARDTCQPRCCFYSSIEVIKFATSLADHQYIDLESNPYTRGFSQYAKHASLDSYASFLRFFDDAASKVSHFFPRGGSCIKATRMSWFAALACATHAWQPWGCADSAGLWWCGQNGQVFKGLPTSKQIGRLLGIHEAYVRLT